MIKLSASHHLLPQLTLARCITLAISVSLFSLCICVCVCHSCTVILLSSLPPTVKDEWSVAERAVLPVLLPTLPQPHCRQARLPAPRAHVRLRSTAGGGRPSARRGLQRAGAQRHVGFRGRGLGGQMEASPDRAGGVSVLAARAGHDRGVPHPLQSGKPSRMHVHPLCSERQVGHPKGSATV